MLENFLTLIVAPLIVRIIAALFSYWLDKKSDD